MNATLIIIVVFLPLFFLSGVEGRLLAPLGIAYIASIGASLIVALTVTPALCSYMLPRAKFMAAGTDSFVVANLKRSYGWSLEKVLARPGTVIAGSVIALLASLVILPFLGRAFLPEFNEGSLTISVVTMPGTSLANQTGWGTGGANPAVASVYQVDGQAYGQGELDEHAQGVNLRSLMRASSSTVNQRRKCSRSCAGASPWFPGRISPSDSRSGHRIDHMLSGTRANIAGENLRRTSGASALWRAALKGNGAGQKSWIWPSNSKPTFHRYVSGEPPAMAKYGMTVADGRGDRRGVQR